MRSKMNSKTELIYDGWVWPKFAYRKQINYSKFYTQNINNQYCCIQCNKIIGDFTKVKYHQRKVHTPIHQMYGCIFCSRKFACSALLKRHTNAIHMSLKPYQCVYCLKRFGRKDNAQRHMKKCSTNKKKQ